VGVHKVRGAEFPVVDLYCVVSHDPFVVYDMVLCVWDSYLVPVGSRFVCTVRLSVSPIGLSPRLPWVGLILCGGIVGLLVGRSNPQVIKKSGAGPIPVVVD